MLAQKLGMDGIKTDCAHRMKYNNRDSNNNSLWTIFMELSQG